MKGRKQLDLSLKKSKKDVCKPIKISGAFSNNFVEYKSGSKKVRSISIARYLNNIRTFEKIDR